MKKEKMISLFIVMVLIVCGLPCRAFADNEDISIIEMDPENIICQNEVIGKFSDQDGIILPDRATTRTIGTLFTLSANKVYNLLTSAGASGKNFTGGYIDGTKGEGLQIKGTVNSSVDSSATIKCGACYYNANADEFVSVAWDYWESGVEETHWFHKLNFNNQMTYYGHITNNVGTGYVYGTLTYSVAKNPNR